MSLSLTEKMRIAFLSFFMVFGLVLVISFFSIMITEVIIYENFKALIFFLPIGAGLFIFFLSHAYLNEDEEFAKVNKEEEK